jgi:hypothetical protein
MVSGVSAQINNQRDDETEQSKSREKEKEVEEFVVVQPDCVVYEWAVVIEQEDAFSTDTAVFGPKGTSHMTGMTKGL